MPPALPEEFTAEALCHLCDEAEKRISSDTMAFEDRTHKNWKDIS